MSSGTEPPKHQTAVPVFLTVLYYMYIDCNHKNARSYIIYTYLSFNKNNIEEYNLT